MAFRLFVFAYVLLLPTCSFALAKSCLNVLGPTGVPLLNAASAALTAVPPEVIGVPGRSPGKRVEDFLEALCFHYRDVPDILETKLSLLSNAHQFPNSIVQIGKMDLRREEFFDLVVFLRYFEKEESQTLLTQCDMRFILEQYVLKKKFPFRSDKLVEDFVLAKSKFSRECSESERNSFVFFRGDSTLWPLFGEPNVMRFIQSAFHVTCSKPKRDAVQENFCGSYRSRPFATRRAAWDTVLNSFLKCSDEDLAFLSKVNQELVISLGREGAHLWMVQETEDPFSLGSLLKTYTRMRGNTSVQGVRAQTNLRFSIRELLSDPENAKKTKADSSGEICRSPVQVDQNRN
ncbi:MAG: hypothetical protein KDD64_07525, partial [Bdellovibrionales bacterium]|nr:hypothetical protein [Bdellovibrionales bacterium]